MSTSPERPVPGNPIRIIASKELRESLRDGRFRLLAASVLVLLAAGLVAGWLETREARQAIESARAQEQATWLEQGPRNPHSAAHFGHYAFKPRPALSALDRGVDAYLGTAVWLKAHWQDPFALRPAEDRTAVQRFGELTAAFTLQVLAPLLIIVLGFAAFSGERERGTLLQLASLGLAPRSLALGKALGLGAALALVLGPAALLGGALVALGALGPAGGVEEGLFGAVVLAAVYGAYFAVWLGLVLAVSAWASRARTALVVLLGFWMIQAVLVPRLVADAAERTYPIPTARAFYAAIAEDEARGMDGQGTRAERRKAFEQKVLDEHGVDSIDALPVNFAGLSLQASEEHSNLVFDAHYGDLWQRYLGQERLHLWGSVLSPSLAVRALSMAVVGTDVARHRHFAVAAEDHRRELVKFLNDDMAENAGNDGFAYLADEVLWRAAPAFEYRPPSLGAALARQGPALAWLAAWCALAFVLATLAVTRLRVVPEAKP